MGHMNRSPYAPLLPSSFPLPLLLVLYTKVFIHHPIFPALASPVCISLRHGAPLSVCRTHLHPFARTECFPSLYRHVYGHNYLIRFPAHESPLPSNWRPRVPSMRLHSMPNLLCEFLRSYSLLPCEVLRRRLRQRCLYLPGTGMFVSNGSLREGGEKRVWVSYRRCDKNAIREQEPNHPPPTQKKRSTEKAEQTADNKGKHAPSHPLRPIHTPYR
ncbi:hypothetical protein B0H63DRAFT_50722 [Podospora didyma]|uniref:Uncharacterized protein n=1 Tax=Podospora didyma TaxID=330526 RepID=A0AAE0P744_9PEZI|nr:hypothetical protein B0H63DRAFT_50722 [Podospora didyma]